MVSSRRARSLLVLVVASGVALSPAPGLAQAPSAPAEDPVAVEAKALYEQGRSAYNSSDYERSVDLFRAAFEKAEKIASEELQLRVVTTLWFNLARAQLKAYDIDEDKRRLRQGKDLIGKYLRNTELSAEERTEAEAVEAEIEARLAKATSGLTPDARPGETQVDDPSGGEEPAAETSGDTRGSTPARKPGRALLVSGAVVAGVGAAAGGALIGAGGAMGEKQRSAYDDATTQAERDDALAGFDRARGMGIAGIAVGSALVVTGVALVAVGVVKQRKARVSPMAGRGTYGVALSMSF